MHLQDSSARVLTKDLRASISEVLPALEARAIRLARSRPDAEDLVQETVVRALRFESTFERGTNVRAWMQQILQSVFISRCRRRVRERRAFERFTADPTLSAHASAPPVLTSVSSPMYAAFTSLPEKFRKVVELVDLRDCSYREAAEALDIPVGTVMSRLFRARRMLAAALGVDRLSDATQGAGRAITALTPATPAPRKPRAAAEAPLAVSAVHVAGVNPFERASEPLRAA
jgi:RNA polymerase sigma-70 factor (ECF subfamily)